MTYFDKLFQKFEKLRMSMPMIKPIHKTPLFAYLARTDSGIVVKLTRKDKIILNPDGTWEFYGKQTEDA